MYNKLTYFFRMRRQSDIVKIICIFTLAGMACFTNTAYHIWEIYIDVNTPAEYVLTGEGRISEKRMGELRQNKGVAKVARQMECPISVMYGGKEVEISCTLIAKEYLEEMFQTDFSAGTKKIYMNDTAFLDFKEQLQENNLEIADLDNMEENDVKELNIRYSPQDETTAEGKDAAKKYKSAKLIVVENGGEDEEGYAYTAETDSRLQKEADSLRVQFAGHDLDGLQVSALRKMGYEIQNEDAVITEEYELELKQLHIRYGLFSCILCVAAVFGLKMKACNKLL